MNINDIITQVKKLPTTPQVLPRLLTVLRDAESSADDVVNLIKLDPPLMAQVMKVSNSGYYAVPSGNTDLKRAVAHIGLGETYKIVSGVIGKELGSKALKAYDIDEGGLWQSAIGAAVCMELLSKIVKTDSVEAYTIGLFHNLGKIIIDNVVGEAYQKIYATIEAKNCCQAEAEREVLGFDYCEVGAILLEHWDFPPEIVSPIRFQLVPMATTEHRKPAGMLHISTYILSAIGLANGRDAYAFQVVDDALSLLKLEQNHLEQLMIDVHNRIQEIRTMFA